MTVSNATPQQHQHDTRAWQTALDQALAAHGGERALARYDHLAHAFPAPEYDPHDDHHPHLNLDALKRWALYRGWRAQPDTDRVGLASTPPIRFTRLSRHRITSH
ncbi:MULTISPECIES: hypothetical protein [Halomonas]|uniref:hypothetical protein n=1 Tax=Halomonas TaxID=2745 RepID=UPI001C98C751|nr:MULTISPECIES: hypothetical protein [Halomonas]MED5294848.1 hypothetical protein [Pseudomonadota bacterium]MBY5924829.1 hypothetical protein [Halomonas sp. DP4Y7-2]MBY5968779.1 hypothetical protein [Halomonas denitrificans]MBY5983844.1 hypothetical protein [Halomonas sp. DP5Y7-2]MBY6028575.1 hypothetical protein [Halomonas sp. DP8Y7-1]